MTLTGLNHEFIRKYEHITNVKSCTYFNDHLKDMVTNGEMFAAIRENTLDFYYIGRRAVRRTRNNYRINKFYTDGVPRKGSPETSFMPDDPGFEYGTLLANCMLKAKSAPEAKQISQLYEPYSFLSKHSDKNKPVLIDIEVRFASLRENANDKDNDRIDLVFFMPKKEALMFVEVKRRKDPRIRAENKNPDVVGQVVFYREQIEKRKEKIIEAYKNVAQTMNEIFGHSFPKPSNIIPSVPILVVDDPGEDTSDKQLYRKMRDTWLEPELASLGNKQIWKKNDIHLIDGRKIFNEHENRMPELAKILEDISEEIQ